MSETAMILAMKYSLIIFIILLGLWFLAVLIDLYHVYAFRYPGDRSYLAFIAFLVASSFILIYLVNNFSAYFYGGSF